MKILFFSHYFPPEGNAPAARTFQMCRRWAAKGNDVTVITCAPNVPNGVLYDGYRNRIRQTQSMEGITVVRVWTYLAPNRGRVRRILNYLSYLASAGIAGLFAPRPDLVIATTPQFFCGWAGALVARARRIPFVLEVRDLWPESIVTVGAMKKGRLTRLLEWMETRLYGAAKRIVTVGDGYRDRLAERGVPREKIDVITNGVDRATFAPRARNEDLARRYGLSGSFVCAYVGTIGMACGLEVVLRAAQILEQRGRADIRFLLVGDGASREALARQAAEQNLRAVVFAGLQPRSAIPDFLSIADACLVHLRRTELFTSVLPSKIFEACAMGKPILLGVKGHAAELVSRMEAGICIKPEDAEDLAAAVERLADYREAARRMGRAGYEYVTAHFDLDVLADNYLSVIQEAIQS